MRKVCLSGLLSLISLPLLASLGAQAQSWSFTGSMQQTRHYFTATLLNNGQVLVAGGTHRGAAALAEADSITQPPETSRSPAA